MSFIVAIDGPAGTGKGTITKLIAKELGFVNIDTGAMYRCATLQTLRQGITNIEEKEKIIQITQNIDIKMKSEAGEQQIYLNDENVSKEIRSKEVSAFVSPVSSIPEVRKIMVDLQRKMAQNADVIMEGRDITTVVFPNANVKIYLDASVEERAKRRYKENQEKGISMTYEEVLEAIKTRDYNDMNKPVGALKIADDAIVIDSTKLSIEQVKEQLKKDFQGMEEDLDSMQQVIDSGTIGPKKKEAWLSFGIAICVILANEVDGLEWMTLIDGNREAPVLQNLTTGEWIDPMKLVWSKVKAGEPCNLVETYKSLF
mgnify:CR=1 FL=1